MSWNLGNGRRQTAKGILGSDMLKCPSQTEVLRRFLWREER